MRFRRDASHVGWSDHFMRNRALSDMGSFLEKGQMAFLKAPGLHWKPGALSTNSAVLCLWGKLLLPQPAERAHPILREGLKAGAGRHAVIRVSHLGVIDIATGITDILFHACLLLSILFFMIIPRRISYPWVRHFTTNLPVLPSLFCTTSMEKMCRYFSQPKPNIPLLILEKKPSLSIEFL